MPEVTDLPAVNAALNAVSAAFLSAGLRPQSGGARIDAHRRCMLAAFATSTLFLVSYLVYHYHVGSVPLHPPGDRFASSTSPFSSANIVLAAAILPLALVTLQRALRGRFARHAAFARWTLPIWLYVSVTGIAVYWMLYEMGS